MKYSNSVPHEWLDEEENLLKLETQALEIKKPFARLKMKLEVLLSFPKDQTE
jgi:hypothetical protein